jgi:hypothetical protein
MMDKQRVQEIGSLLAICILGAIVLAVVLFIATLSADTSRSSPSTDATSTAQ